MDEEKRILICNDSPKESRILKGILKQSGFTVDCISEASSIIATLMWKRHHACIISFSNLSHFNALHVASSIYEKNLPSEVGIILTGGREDNALLCNALEEYADAVVSIPYDLPLLSGVVTSVIRRERSRNVDFYSTTSEQIYVGSSIIDTGKRSLSYGNEKFTFTKSQFQVFMLLIMNKTKTLTRENILKNIKGEKIFLDSRTVDNTIYQLRKKLKETCFHIDTVSGLGYSLSLVDC
ncbi:response regulator transcription factor [bacterium]|nr:response regulator transcription factor [bacterium]